MEEGEEGGRGGKGEASCVVKAGRQRESNECGKLVGIRINKLHVHVHPKLARWKSVLLRITVVEISCYSVISESTRGWDGREGDVAGKPGH